MYNMRKTKRTIILLASILLLVACNNKTVKENSIAEIEQLAVADTETVTIENNKSVVTEKEGNLLFSTNDLENAKRYSPEEYPLKAVGHDGKVYDSVDYLIKAPDYKRFQLIIWFTAAGDDIPYALCVVKDGVYNINDGLSITPRWSEPGNDENNYRYEYFEIYEDYTIRIDTEMGNEGVVEKHTKYYRISDDGEFYEI